MEVLLERKLEDNTRENVGLNVYNEEMQAGLRKCHLNPLVNITIKQKATIPTPFS